MLSIVNTFQIITITLPYLKIEIPYLKMIFIGKCLHLLQITIANEAAVFNIMITISVQTKIFHKNREISILTIEKKPTARLTLLQEATERSKLGKTKTKKKTAV
jgi:hypothetical protein